MTPEIELAIKILKEAGYTVKPPAEIPPQNGFFQVDCSTDVYIVEGKEDERDKICLDFEERGHKVKGISFSEDMFYFQ